MRVLVAGANGNTGTRIVRFLPGQGHQARALIRDPDQGPALEELGAETVVADLEGDVAHAVRGCDAVMFAAGAGPGSGAAKKVTVDQQGAVKLVAAALELGARRYVMLSTMGADDPDSGSERMRPYFEAKARADEALRDSGLDFTIVRPGRLTDEPGRGTVHAAVSVGRSGEISRDDVAATMVAALDIDTTIGATFELLSGDVPIARALAAL